MPAEEPAVKLGVRVVEPVSGTSVAASAGLSLVQLSTCFHVHRRLSPQGVFDCGLPSSVMVVDTVPLTFWGAMSASMSLRKEASPNSR